MRSITHLVLHTAAAERNGDPVDQSAETIRAYHKRKGWSDIGYHFVVRFDGTVEPGRPIENPGAHVQGFNAHSIGICFSGHGDLSDFTDAQRKPAQGLFWNFWNDLASTGRFGKTRCACWAIGNAMRSPGSSTPAKRARVERCPVRNFAKPRFGGSKRKGGNAPCRLRYEIPKRETRQ